MPDMVFLTARLSLARDAPACANLVYRSVRGISHYNIGLTPQIRQSTHNVYRPKFLTLMIHTFTESLHI